MGSTKVPACDAPKEKYSSCDNKIHEVDIVTGSSTL